jgi:hypothetical protein
MNEAGKPELLCYCLEDAIRQTKIAKQTAIPTGVYPVRFRKEGRLHTIYQQKFVFHKGMLEICELPNFKFVMFHIGNDIGDTEGCPLVGTKPELVNGDFRVNNSTSTYIEVYPKIAALLLSNKEVLIEIVNAPNIKMI